MVDLHSNLDHHEGHDHHRRNLPACANLQIISKATPLLARNETVHRFQQGLQLIPRRPAKMGRMKKSTRKFEKNHLKDTIDRRKDVAKIRQRNQIKEKKRSKRAKDENSVPDADVDKLDGGRGGRAEGKPSFDDMTVDDFFQGRFDIPEKPKKKIPKTRSVKDASQTSTKRKRAGADEKLSDASGASSLERDAVAGDSDLVLDESDDLDAHQGDLEALAEKDPEFYQHLKDNDPELLNFTDLAEVDGLSDGDDKPAESEKKRRKTTDEPGDQDWNEEQGQSNDETEVTLAVVEKWKTAMTQQHSLRAMRQVVLAFRAAVHVNEEEGKAYKYTISSPAGMWCLFV